ncbi:MAG TPA: methylated-DNA--[protein]-cysteine S-methyltransferase [Phycisphaerales bacterium]|nr:methylated-DNA--[protein]-cysteine S-methyltransferase [Phycisphaerales bacterium]
MEMQDLSRVFGCQIEAAGGDGSGTSATILLDEVDRQLAEYFSGARQSFDLPLDLRGSAHQMRVWAELLRIPFGETISYGELAERVGSSPRAVGGANGSNRVPIVVPCHRVIAVDGSLGGFGGGVSVKRRLLELEGARAVFNTKADQKIIWN